MNWTGIQTTSRMKTESQAGDPDAVAFEAHSETDCSLCTGLRLFLPHITSILDHPPSRLLC